MRYLSFIIILSSFVAVTELVFEGQVSGQFKLFTTDKLGNIFTITPKNDIQKFDKKGKKITEANFKVLGDASQIDASNPLEIYVFYKDQNKMVYFDNMLNYRGETDIYKSLGVTNIIAVCRSYDNGFWFFDPDNFKLKKADKAGNLLAESINLAGVADTTLNPQMILDDGQFVYLKSNLNRLLVFDILGNFIKIVVLENFNSFQSKDGKILYGTADDLIMYNASTFEKGSVLTNSMAGNNFLNSRLEGKNFYFQDSSGIRIYSRNE